MGYFDNFDLKMMLSKCQCLLEAELCGWGNIICARTPTIYCSKITRNAIQTCESKSLTGAVWTSREVCALLYLATTLLWFWPRPPFNIVISSCSAFPESISLKFVLRKFSSVYGWVTGQSGARGIFKLGFTDGGWGRGAAARYLWTFLGGGGEPLGWSRGIINTK